MIPGSRRYPTHTVNIDMRDLTTAVRSKGRIWWFIWTVFSVLPNVQVLFCFVLPTLANNGVRYSCKRLAVAQYSSILFHVPSNFTSVAPIHQELPTLKSTLAHFVLLLSLLKFHPFVQPVKLSWLINIIFCVSHTAGFSGSCPVSENLTYGHGVAMTKVLFILPPHPHLPRGPQMVWGVKLATLLSDPPPPPSTGLQATAARRVHW